MKKLFALLLCIVMVMSMAACGNTTPLETTNAPADNQEVTQATEAPAAVENEPVVEEKRPVMPAVVGLDRGYIMGYENNGVYAFKGVP